MFCYLFNHDQTLPLIRGHSGAGQIHLPSAKLKEKIFHQHMGLTLEDPKVDPMSRTTLELDLVS